MRLIGIVLVLFSFSFGIEVSSPEQVQGPGFLVWACNSVLSDSSCIGVVTFSGSNITQKVDLRGQVAEIQGFAVDVNVPRGYVFGRNSRTALSLIIVNLTTSAYSTASFTVPISSKDLLLDTAVDSSGNNIFLLVQSNFLIPSLSTLKLQQLDIKSGKLSTVITFQTEDTQYTYFSSSFSKSGMFYLIMANSTGFFLFKFDSGMKAVTQLLAPYGFVGSVFNDKTSTIVGNIMLSYNGTNTLAFMNPISGSITTASNSFHMLYCGAITPHAGLDVAGNSYYTVCCKDMSDCTSNGSLTVIDATTNIIKNSYSLVPSQVLNFGYTWIPARGNSVNH